MKTKARQFLDLIEDKKDPFSDAGFEKKFIGRSFTSSVPELLNYDLEKSGVNPVLDKDHKILGFVYDGDHDDEFMGHKISSLGFRNYQGIDIYEM